MNVKAGVIYVHVHLPTNQSPPHVTDTFQSRQVTHCFEKAS